jgi:hypothetical protein
LQYCNAHHYLLALLQKTVGVTQMRRIPLLALFACAPLVASAGDEAGHFYIGPEVGGIVASGDRGTKEHDWVYGLDLG